MSKKHKKKKTASGGNQLFSFQSLIISNVAIRQRNDVFNEHIQIIKAAFDSLTSGKSSVL